MTRQRKACMETWIAGLILLVIKLGVVLVVIAPGGCLFGLG